MNHRKCILWAAVAALAISATAPVLANHHEGEEPKFKITGEVRARLEVIDNTVDLTDNTESGGSYDDGLDFWPYRARIGAKGMFAKNVFGFIELQGFGNFGDRSDDELFLGFADPGNQNALDDNDSQNRGADIYQAFILLKNIGDSNFSAKIGRQEVVIGNELHFGDHDYYNGQYFDGARGWWDWENVDFGLMFFNIDEESAPGFESNCLADAFDDLDESDCSNDNTSLFGAHAAFTVGDGIGIEPYIFSYRDNEDGLGTLGELTRTPFIAVPSSVKTNTIGVLFDDPREDDEDQLIDWSAEVAIQTGEVDPTFADLDHSASVFEGEVGFNLGDEGQHRLHINALMTSGDDDVTDTDAEGFFPLFPDHHSGGRLGNVDLFGPRFLGGLGPNGLGTGVTDFSVGYTGSFGAHTVGVAVHNITATETGVIVDFTGIDEDELGTEFDVMYNFDYSQNVAFNVEISNFDPGDAFAVLAAAGFGDASAGDLQDAATRIAGQVRLRW